MENNSLLAAIDLGSNTLRLACAAPLDNFSHSLKITGRGRWLIRLGEGFDLDGYLTPPAMDRAFSSLKELSLKIRDYACSQIILMTTGVVREAKNQKEFLLEVRHETGLDAKVLKGEEEASISLLGVRSTLPDLSQEQLLICDIGGGSSELAYSDRGCTVASLSVPLGAIRLHERFKIPAPMQKGIKEEMEGFIKQFLTRPASIPCSISAFVATAGTPATLACIDQGIEIYDPIKVHGHKMGMERVREIYELLSSLSLEQRRGVPGLEPGREDIIIPGAALLLRVMEAFGLDSLIVSEGGLLEGSLALLYHSIKGSYPVIVI